MPTATPPSKISLPPPDVFEETPPSLAPPSSRGRRSFSTVRARRVSIAEDEPPKLPSLVPGIRPAYSTPLPLLPMIVLCIAMLSELLSANLSTPFLLKMVEGFFLSSGHEKNSETEAAVGLWTGNLVSVFFITQFFTSILWSSIADRHGRRAVLVASLTGSALALVVFGTSESLPEAICVRLVQGIFGGAVGVYRGSIRDITDDTNAGRAYAILGFSWGFGGVMGPILGGVFESPAQNFPGSFLGEIPLFNTFPYLLPTIIASCLLISGAVLSCFLSWDGGVRGGSRIALAIEKDEPLVRGESPAPSTMPSLRPRRSFLSPSAVSPGVEESAPHGRRDSRASLGTAYGYGGIRSKHPTLAARAAIEAARRVSTANNRPPEEEEEPTLAERLLLANEENTFNINDLWVSAAVAQDNAVFEDEDEDEGNATPMGSTTVTPSEAPSTIAQRRGRMASGTHRVISGSRFSVSRRFSGSSSQMPAIFNNTGVETAISLDESSNDPFFPSPANERRPGALDPIAERPPSVSEAKPSLLKSLPLLMILQYGLLALHNTTHDQLFLSFLVTPYRSGGIGLNPANFSLIIALMCLFQLVYQFYLYPRLGPPLGQFTHLQMFRIGCSLYIPSYIALPLLRSVASPNSSGGFVVMTLLTLVTAVRYCGGTLAYTSVMVLINAMSPPHVVGLANGLAQSTVSFSRFFGPVIGGAIWSASINNNPSGYATGFYVVTLGVIAQLSSSFLVR